MAELFTVKDLSAKSGKSFPEVEQVLREHDLQPVERKGLLRYYGKDAVDLLEEEVAK